MKTKLPEGWKEVECKDLFELKYCSSLPEDERISGNYCVYGSNGVVGLHNQAITKGKTIIVGRKGSIGKVNFSEKKCFPIDTTYYIDETKKPCDLAWLYYLLKILRMENMNKAAAVPGLNRNDVYQIKIKFPPLPTQQKIVSILEKAEQAKEMRKEADELTKDFLKLILYQFLKFTNIHIKQEFHNTDKTLPKGFLWKRLSEVCLDIADIDHKMPKAVQNGVPFISAKDLTDEGDILFDNTKYISHTDFKRLSRKIKPEKGDIIYSRIGTVGRAAIVKVDIDFLPSYSCCTIKPNLNIINGEYLACCLNSGIVLMQAQHGTRGIGVPDLGMKEIKDFLIPLPPIELQNKFASLVREVESMKEQQKHSKEQLDNLFNALMQKAFKGEMI